MIKIHAHPSTRLPVHVHRGAHYSGAGESGWYLTGPAIGPVNLVLVERPDFDDTDPDEAADELHAFIVRATLPTEAQIRALDPAGPLADYIDPALAGDDIARMEIRDALIIERAALEAREREAAEARRVATRPEPVNIGATAIRSTYPSKAHTIARVQWRETDDPSGGSWWRVDALDSEGDVIVSAFVGDGDNVLGVYLPDEIHAD